MPSIHTAFRLLIASGCSLCAAMTATAGPADTPPARLAVIGFEPTEAADPRDAWIGSAIENMLARRLTRVPDLTAIPPNRLHQARAELSDQSPPTRPWKDVVRAAGARHYVTGGFTGPPHAATVSLRFIKLTRENADAISATLGPRPILPLLDDATRWILRQLDRDNLAAQREAQLFAPLTESVGCLEYYARSVDALRAGEVKRAVDYAADSISYDQRFRPALAGLAQLELRISPRTRLAAQTRLRILAQQARAAGDQHDLLQVMLAESVSYLTGGNPQLALAQLEDAVALANEISAPYAELAAMSSIVEVYLNRLPPVPVELEDQAVRTFRRENLRQAARWQQLILDKLDTLHDQVALIPAANRAGLIAEQRGKLDEALAFYSRARDLSQQHESRRNEATAWMFIAQVHQQAGRTSPAIAAAKECLARAPESEQPAVRVLLAKAYRDASPPQLDAALEHLLAAFKQLQKSDRLREQLICLAALADLHERRGATDKAVEALVEAAEIAHALRDPLENELRAKLTKLRE